MQRVHKFNAIKHMCGCAVALCAIVLKRCKRGVGACGKRVLGTAAGNCDVTCIKYLPLFNLILRFARAVRTA